MPESVTVTVIWKTNPDSTEACIEALRKMFLVTRTFHGFQSIRLMTSAHDPDELILIQEWATVGDHQKYMKFRTEAGDIENLMRMAASPMQLAYWTSPSLAAAGAD